MAEASGDSPALARLREARRGRPAGEASPGLAAQFREWLAARLTDERTSRELVDRGRVGHYTLALTRWVAIIGQLFTVLFVHFSLGIALPLVPLLAAVALAAAANLLLAWALGWRARLAERAAAGMFVFDLLQLWFLLWLTGGIQNPFAVLLLVPVAIAAGLLGRFWTGAVTGLGLVLVTLLTVDPRPLPWFDGGLVLPDLYRFALWAGLGTAMLLTAIYSFQFAEEARHRAEALAATRLALAREQELAALGGQAAAAAHMLGSPLATIAVVARELVNSLPPDHPLFEDASEILGQVDRCREILKTLGPRRGGREVERFAPAPLSALLAEIAGEFGRAGVEVAVSTVSPDGTPEPVVALPPDIRHAIANLVDNAIQFAESRVDIEVAVSRERLAVAIRDDGPGFAPDILDWIGEPYLSTRHDQGGLGLGIFIANTLLARTGARLHFGNRDRGAEVLVEWPAGALERAVEERDDDGGSV